MIKASCVRSFDAVDIGGEGDSIVVTPYHPYKAMLIEEKADLQEAGVWFQVAFNLVWRSKPSCILKLGLLLLLFQSYLWGTCPQGRGFSDSSI